MSILILILHSKETLNRTGKKYAAKSLHLLKNTYLGNRNTLNKK
jgi:hypothetical protein